MHVNSVAMMKADTPKIGLTNATPISTVPKAAEQPAPAVNGKQFHNNAGKCILHLFSGPHHREDGFAAAVMKHGHRCVEYDVINGPNEDLTSDAIWSKLLEEIKRGAFDALLAGPPCNTFTNARKDDGLGPMPLRGPSGHDRYGLSGLEQSDMEKVKAGTLLATRASTAAKEFHQQRKPYIVEQPLWKQDGRSVSMYNLDEFKELMELPGVETKDIVQCEYGAETSKPTTLLLGHIRNADFKEKCSHQARSWRKPSTGEKHWGPHPPLRGKEMFILAERWNRNMLRTPKQIAAEQRHWPFLTSAAQAYPSLLNQKLCTVLLDNTAATITPNDDDMVVMGRWKNVMKRKAIITEERSVKARVEFTAPLKGRKRQVRDLDMEDEQYLGGMRNPRSATTRIPEYRQACLKVYKVLMTCLAEDATLRQRCLDAIGDEQEDAGPTEVQLDRVRQLIWKATAMSGQSTQKTALDSKLQADLLWQLARAAGDPDADCIQSWLTEGAPAGISKNIEDPGRIFPPDVPGDFHEGAELPDHTLHKNYTSVDDDPAAGPEVERLIETGFVQAFSTHDELSKWLGGPPHLSKLGMITKEKDGRVKRRLILDCKESGVNRLARSGGRLILPRVSDIVDDALYLMSQSTGPDQQIEWLILDFTDWFYNVPLHPDERRHFTWAYGKHWVAFKAQAQGSRNAPLVCGRVAALIARLTQGVFGDQKFRLQIYVDDPCICVLGTTKERNMQMAATILLWACLGIRLAYKKASRGTAVTWIGAELRAENQGTSSAQIQVNAKKEIVDEVLETTKCHSISNMENKKALQTYVGKLNHIAGIVELLRPFLGDLYGVLYQTGATNAPKNCYWTKQWRHVTQWMLAFLERSSGKICRVYRMKAYFGRGLPVAIVTDASPWPHHGEQHRHVLLQLPSDH